MRDLFAGAKQAGVNAIFILLDLGKLIPVPVWHFADQVFLSVWLNFQIVGHSLVMMRICMTLVGSWLVLNWNCWALCHLFILGVVTELKSAGEGTPEFLICVLWNAYEISLWARQNVFLTAHSVPLRGIGKIKLFYDALLTVILT